MNTFFYKDLGEQICEIGARTSRGCDCDNGCVNEVVEIGIRVGGTTIGPREVVNGVEKEDSWCLEKGNESSSNVIS